MDWGNLATIISSLGFPIVCCIFMGYFLKDLINKQREETKELNAQHKEEMLSFRTAIDNNTEALNRIIDKLGGLR